jgi:hypothetical protein
MLVCCRNPLSRSKHGIPLQAFGKILDELGNGRSLSRFQGHAVDPADIPEFQQCEQEARTGKYLEEEGASKFVSIWHDWQS